MLLIKIVSEIKTFVDLQIVTKQCYIIPNLVDICVPLQKNNQCKEINQEKTILIM